ncbi:helix-turn-helix domain-containing protein [Streptomyces sp. cg28]|uniref:helix-turn-helix domain-containing protein n=1 Tax=Streptomyces sp. cg28 TaxID=3403457 RepID=UPI003B225043
MATTENPRPLSAVVGESLRKFREDRGVRQEDLADEARKYGFTWGRSSVAALEAGNRDLSIGELLIIPSIVKKLGGWSEPLVPPNTVIALNESLWMNTNQLPSHIITLLSATENPISLPEGEPLNQEDEDVELGSLENYGGKEDTQSFEFRKRIALNVKLYEVMLRKLWPDKSDVAWPGIATGYEVAKRIGERITMPNGLTADGRIVQAFSLGMWGRPVGDERDARAAMRGNYETKRALQSARGHVTRELTEEIQAEINNRWPDVMGVIKELETALDTEEGFAEWEDMAYELRHGQLSSTGESPRSHRKKSKRTFRLGR